MVLENEVHFVNNPAISEHALHTVAALAGSTSGS